MLALTFQVGRDRVALDVRRINEVVPRVPLSRPEGSPAWLAGMFMYRGSVVPVIDLFRLLDAGECPGHLSSRIVIVPINDGNREVEIGLLAARVSQIRDLEAAPQPLSDNPRSHQPDLGPLWVDRGEVLRLVDLERLLPQSVLSHLIDISPKVSA